MPNSALRAALSSIDSIASNRITGQPPPGPCSCSTHQRTLPRAAGVDTSHSAASAADWPSSSTTSITIVRPSVNVLNGSCTWLAPSSFIWTYQCTLLLALYQSICTISSPTAQIGRDIQPYRAVWCLLAISIIPKHMHDIQPYRAYSCSAVQCSAVRCLPSIPHCHRGIQPKPDTSVSL